MIKNLKGRPRRRAVHDLLRQLLLLSRRGCSRSATPRTRTPRVARKAMGQSPAGLFGYSHMLGGFPGGQAEYLRVPFADVGPIKIPERLPDEQVLFPLRHLPDRLHGRRKRRDRERATPSRSGAAGRSGSSPSRAPGCSAPAGDRHRPGAGAAADGPEHGKAETINFEEQDVYDRLMEMTSGRGPDRCIDAVGRRGACRRAASMRCSTRRRQAVMLGHRPATRAARGDHVLPQGRHGLDPRRLHRVPRQDSVRRRDEQRLDAEDGPDACAALSSPLLKKIEAGEIDPSFVITHRLRSTSARGLQDLPRQGGWLHQGGAETCCVSRYTRARLKRNTREPFRTR